VVIKVAVPRAVVVRVEKVAPKAVVVMNQVRIMTVIFCMRLKRISF